MVSRHSFVSLFSLAVLFLFTNLNWSESGDLMNTADQHNQKGSQFLMSASSPLPEASLPVSDTELDSPLAAQTGLAALWPFHQTKVPAVREKLPGDLERFIKRVKNGEARQVRGVYVSGTIALPVIQQPEEEPAFVSEKWGEITQFRSAAFNNITGLLAHNYLSGGEFYELEAGQLVNIVYGNGSLRRYRVTEISRFQKLKPSSLRSDFIDLQTGQKLSTAEVFNRFYNGDHKVTFQTCLENEGLSNWGLIFVVAQPVLQ